MAAWMTHHCLQILLTSRGAKGKMRENNIQYYRFPLFAFAKDEQLDPVTTFVAFRCCRQLEGAWPRVIHQ
jgi:hypothetical protein